MSEHTVVNHAFWDEIAPHHAVSEFYAVERFVRTRDSLGHLETAEIGPVAGLSICHLQCHLGLDTLSLAARGAHVTGLDFSGAALKVAQELADRTGIAARFVQADVMDAATVLDRQFDMVFATRGVLMWVPDLARWAENCIRLLRPGGVLYLLDNHPIAMVLRSDGPGLTLQAGYFGGPRPNVTVADGSYAVSDAGLHHRETREWVHPIGDVTSALIAAGMVIDFLHEHPADAGSLTTDAPDFVEAAVTQLPAWYSVRAHRPE